MSGFNISVCESCGMRLPDSFVCECEEIAPNEPVAKQARTDQGQLLDGFEAEHAGIRRFFCGQEGEKRCREWLERMAREKEYEAIT